MKKEYNVVRLRAVACILILISHVFQMYVIEDYTYFHVSTFIHHFLYSIHVPIFMSISGYLFWLHVQKTKGLDTSKERLSSVLAFVKDKALRLLIPFVAVMYLWRKPISLITTNSSGFGGGSILSSLKGYLSFTTTGPLWFLYVLFGIFVIEKLASWWIWKTKRRVDMAMTIFIVIAVVANIYGHGPVKYVLINNVFFFWGAYIHDRYESIHRLVGKYKYLLLIIVLLSTVVYSGPWIKNVYYTGIIYILQALTDILLAFVFTYETARVEAKKWICDIDGLSMGIYLFHSDIIYLIFWMFKGNQGLLCGVVATVCSFIGAVAMTMLIRRLGISFLIGEKKNKGTK